MSRFARGISLLVAVACAPAVAPLAAQAPVTSVNGVAYTQFLYQLADTAAHFNAFDVTRAYLNVMGKPATGLSTRVTVDVYRQAGDPSLRFRLKYAFVGYTPNKSPLTFKLGQIHTAVLDFEEALWDYRMQGAMALDRAGYLASSDFGAGVDGRWGRDRLNLQLAVVNGEGYSAGTGDRYKDVMGRVTVRLLSTGDSSRVGGLRATVYGQIGKPTGNGVRRRLLGLLSFRSKHLTLAGEYAVTADSASGALLSTNGRVISGFGVYRLPGTRLAVIGRADHTDPNTAVSGDRRIRVIAGLSYQLSPNLRVLADWDHLAYETTPTPAQHAVRSQALFQAQFAF